LFAGALQRLAKNLHGESSEKLQRFADGAMLYLSNHRKDELGALPWFYFGKKLPSGKQNKPNDLLHEAYTIEGLLEYYDYGGSLRSELNPHEFVQSLKRYLSSEKVYEFPIEEGRRYSERWARLWAVGYALYVASRLEGYEASLGSDVRKTFFDLLIKYYRDEELWLYRPDEPVDCRGFPRQITHVLMGLAWYEFPKTK